MAIRIVRKVFIILGCTVLSIVGAGAQIEAVIESYGHEAGLLDEDITALLEDSRGVFWVGTRHGGLYTLEFGEFDQVRTVNSMTGYSIAGLAESGQGELIISTPTATYTFDGSKVAESSDQPQVAADLQPRSIEGSQVLCSTEGEMGVRWIGTTDGLYLHQPSPDTTAGYTRIFDNTGMLNGPVQALLFDSNDQLWIGTGEHGLLKYLGVPGTGAPLPGDISIRQIAISPGDDKTLILTKEGRLLCENTDGSGDFSEWHAENAPFLSLFPTSQNIIWLTGLNGGLYVLEGDSLANVSINGVGKTSGWSFFTQSADGQVLGETQEGDVFILAPSFIKSQTPVLRSTGRLKVDIEDEAVNWVAVGIGDWYRVGRKTVMRSRRSGASFSVIYDSGNPIQTACSGIDGALWLGNAAGDIIHLRDDGSEKVLALPMSLEPYQVLFLHNEGNILWLGTDRHLWQLMLSDDQRRAVEMHARYTGVPGELHAGSFTRSSRNELRLATGNTILSFRMQGYTPHRISPTVAISGIEIQGQEIGESAVAGSTGAFYDQYAIPQIPFSKNQIGFSFKGVQHDKIEGGLTYSWKLDGMYPDWSVPGEKTNVQFVGLPPGDYVFDVRVCNVYGVCSSLDKPWKFVVKPAFWHHWWFWVGVVLFLALIGIWVIRSREKRLLLESEREKALLNARLKAHELQQKAMQLQMNPHFIFNALQTVAHHLEDGTGVQVKTELTQFSRLMRSMLNISRSTEVSLEDEIDFLKNYVKVLNMSREEDLRFDVYIPSEINAFDIAIPPMLIQPIIENSAKYGATRIELNISESSGHLEVDVTDNGPGINSQKQRTRSGGENGSVALDLIRERLTGLGGDAGFEITNIAGDNGVVRGAKARLRIPI